MGLVLPACSTRCAIDSCSILITISDDRYPTNFSNFSDLPKVYCQLGSPCAKITFPAACRGKFETMSNVDNKLYHEKFHFVSAVHFGPNKCLMYATFLLRRVCRCSIQSPCACSSARPPHGGKTSAVKQAR